MAEAPAPTFEIDGGVAVLRLDDGKVNAFGPSAVAALDAAVERAETEAGALVIAGREGKFSAGFDLGVIRAGAESARELAFAGARAAMRLYGAGVPVVAACTGHALAYGALLLLASDLRIGADGDSRIGLNEVAVGLAMPVFGMELARDRISPRHLTRSVSLATVYSPTGAVEAGFLDEVVPAEDLESTALARARVLAEGLNRSAFARTRRTARGAVIDRVLATLEEDLAHFGPPV